MWFRAGIAVLGTVYAVSYWMSQSVYRVAMSNSRVLGELSNKMILLQKNIKHLDIRVINQHKDIKNEFEQTNININDIWEATDIISEQIQDLGTETFTQYQTLIEQMETTYDKVGDIHSNLSEINQAISEKNYQLMTVGSHQENTNVIVSSIEKKIDYIINIIHTPKIE